jgi:hypothetical protein
MNPHNPKRITIWQYAILAIARANVSTFKVLPVEIEPLPLPRFDADRTYKRRRHTPVPNSLELSIGARRQDTLRDPGHSQIGSRV